MKRATHITIKLCYSLQWWTWNRKIRHFSIKIQLFESLYLRNTWLISAQ